MMSLLTNLSELEDSLFAVLTKVEDGVLKTARTLIEGSEPVTRRWPERPSGGLVPAPAEMATHAFDLADRLVTNLRDFTAQLMTLAPSTAESQPTPAKTAPTPHLVVPTEVAALIALALAVV
jgi:hypothetical protein